MREELKQRESELEKSLEDKQQLKNQVQNLKEGLQNLQNTHAMQVSLTENTYFNQLDFLRMKKREEPGVFPWCFLYKSSFLGYSLLFEHYLICILIRKKLVQDEFQRMKDIGEINH